VDSLEIGAKSTWMDGNLLLNASLFHQQYSDFQLNSFLGTSYVVRSIPELVTQGLDAEILWQPRRGLMLQGGVTYIDAQYGADLAWLPWARAGFGTRWSSTASVTDEWDVGGALAARFNLGAKYTSSYNAGSDLDPQKEQGAYTLLNARVGLGRQDRRWAVELW